jgi:hypothetical protein
MRRFSVFAVKMRRDRSKTHEPKARYRVRNWAAYNTGLINRGNVTMRPAGYEVNRPLE